VSVSDEGGGGRGAGSGGVGDVGDTDATLFARTLLAAGELARAADVVVADPADPLACFLHYYATYLASEKRREDARGDVAGTSRWYLPSVCA
jgi:hypothetical protein